MVERAGGVGIGFFEDRENFIDPLFSLGGRFGFDDFY